jgi:hypothetical protein
MIESGVHTWPWPRLQKSGCRVGGGLAVLVGVFATQNVYATVMKTAAEQISQQPCRSGKREKPV